MKSLDQRVLGDNDQAKVTQLASRGGRLYPRGLAPVSMFLSAPLHSSRSQVLCKALRTESQAWPNPCLARGKA